MVPIYGGLTVALVRIQCPPFALVRPQVVVLPYRVRRTIRCPLISLKTKSCVSRRMRTPEAPKGFHTTPAAFPDRPAAHSFFRSHFFGSFRIYPLQRSVAVWMIRVRGGATPSMEPSTMYRRPRPSHSLFQWFAGCCRSVAIFGAHRLPVGFFVRFHR